MKRISAIAVLAVFLGGCGSAPKPDPEPIVKVVTQKEIVTVPCKPDLGAEPAYPDTDAALKAAPNIFERVKLLVAGRFLRIQRDIEKSAAIEVCRNG